MSHRDLTPDPAPYDHEYAGVYDGSNPFASDAYREPDPKDIDRNTLLAHVRAGGSPLDLRKKPDPARAKRVADLIDDFVIRGLILYPPQVYFAFAGRS